jgi:maltooligosyltrehalose synthase
MPSASRTSTFRPSWRLRRDPPTGTTWWAVDWDRRRNALEELRGATSSGKDRAELARSRSAPDALADGRAKLFLLHAGMEVRRSDRDLLLEGDYRPLAAAGPDAEHVFSFARTRAGRDAVTEAEHAADSIPLAALYADFPVALLVSQ